MRVLLTGQVRRDGKVHMPGIILHGLAEAEARALYAAGACELPAEDTAEALASQEAWQALLVAAAACTPAGTVTPAQETALREVLLGSAVGGVLPGATLPVVPAPASTDAALAPSMPGASDTPAPLVQVSETAPPLPVVEPIEAAQSQAEPVAPMSETGAAPDDLPGTVPAPGRRAQRR